MLKKVKDFDKTLELSQYVVDRWPGADYAVWCRMEVAWVDIHQGNEAAAQSAVDKLSADYANDANLPWALYIIAERYRWGKQYDDAKVLYQRIIDEHAESEWASRARLGLARTGVLDLVESKDYWVAEQEIARMVSDFAGHADLPQTLRDVAEQYQWARKYEESQELCKRAERLEAESAAEVEQEPTLQEQEAAILAMMKERKFEEALSAVDKLIADFAGDAGLAEVVYRITKEFEWAKSAAEDRATRYDIPRAFYQRISRQFVGSPRASDAEWDYKRLTYRTNILTLIASGNSDQNEIDAAIAAMEADFADRPDLILEGLYWIGREYELYPDGADRARGFYERIAVEFPDIPDEANAATMDAVRAAIDVEQRTGKEGQAQETIARLRQRLEGTPRLAYTLYWAAGAYRREAAICERLGTADAFATACLEKAAGLYTEVTELATDSSLAGKAYFFLGGCYRRLQKFSDALGCYRQVQKNWPASQLEAQCLEGISVCYEQLYEQGRVDSSEADDRIEQVYKELVKKYPDSPQSTEALFRMGRIIQ